LFYAPYFGGKYFEENFNLHPKKMTKQGAPTVKMEGPTYSSRGWNRPCMA
jgi:hypothetical protein